MTHRTLILVIRRLSERARKADVESCFAASRYGRANVSIAAMRAAQQEWHDQRTIVEACRAKIDQLTERYS